MRIIVSLIYIIISLTLCGQRAFTEEQLKKASMPKKFFFKLAKSNFTLFDTSVISIKATYINELNEADFEDKANLKTQKSYRFIRFFENGAVFMSFEYLSYPTIEQINDYDYGHFGYYVIEKGKIKGEFYINRQYGVMYLFAKPIENKAIQFYKITGRGLGKFLNISRSIDQTGYYVKSYY
jgi:hypothetical protein